MSDAYTWLLIAIDDTGKQMKTFTSDSLSEIQAKQREWQARGYDTRLRVRRKAQA